MGLRITKKIMTHCVSLFGAPRSLVHDQGEFGADVVAYLVAPPSANAEGGAEPADDMDDDSDDSDEEPHPKRGKKQNKIDVFSAWTPSSYMQLGDLADSVLPNIIVDIADVLQINVELTDNKLPFHALDQLRYDDVVDLTALSYSQTQLGTVYRTHALMSAKPR